MSDQWLTYLHSAYVALRFATGKGGLRYSQDGGQSHSAAAVKALRGILPYCLHPTEAGDTAPLILLNRDYKPLGTYDVDPYVRYENFPWLHVSAGDSRIAPLLALCSPRTLYSDHQPVYYLFDDASSPDRNKTQAIGLMEKIATILPAYGVLHP